MWREYSHFHPSLSSSAGWPSKRKTTRMSLRLLGRPGARLLVQSDGDQPLPEAALRSAAGPDTCTARKCKVSTSTSRCRASRSRSSRRSHRQRAPRRTVGHDPGAGGSGAGAAIGPVRQRERWAGRRPDHQRRHTWGPPRCAITARWTRPAGTPKVLGAAMQRLRPGDEPERAGVHRHLRASRRAAPVQVSPRAQAGADDMAPAAPAQVSRTWRGANESSPRTSRRRSTFGRPRRQE